MEQCILANGVVSILSAKYDCLVVRQNFTLLTTVLHFRKDPSYRFLPTKAWVRFVLNWRRRQRETYQ